MTNPAQLAKLPLYCTDTFHYQFQKNAYEDNKSVPYLWKVPEFVLLLVNSNYIIR